jgi:hypothetical protein
MKMKKLFALAVIFALVLAGCEEEGTLGDGDGSNTTLKIKNESSKTILDVLWNNVAYSDKSSDFNGTWTGSYSENTNHKAGVIEVEISAVSWSVLFKDNDGKLEISSGKLGSRTGNTQYLDYSNNTCGYISLSGNKLILDITNTRFPFPLALRMGTYELTKLGDAFKPGTNVTKNVEVGSSYIFFKVGSTAYRTQSVVKKKKNENKEFIFNDYTVIVDITDSTNTTKPLGGL